jgi:hypothetical protein
VYAPLPLTPSPSPTLTTPPSTPQEAGYNGIHFNQVAHSWVRDVRVVNADSAFYSWGMVFCTLTGLEVASGNRGYDNGHRGIWLERGQDNLIVNFNFTTMMYHDMSVSFYEHSTAFVNGTGKVRVGLGGRGAAGGRQGTAASACRVCVEVGQAGSDCGTQALILGLWKPCSRPCLVN